MKLLAWMLILSFSLLALAQEAQEIEGATKNVILKLASEHFAQGKYNATAEELSDVEKKLMSEKKIDKQLIGLVTYWKAICYNRMQDFPDAIINFEKALGFEYSPQDINYEYGQALFASEKLQEARIQFRESLKRKFKRGVSLYYIAYISKELGEKKKAVAFYKALEKLPEDEAKDVKQAAEMQIGDIYLEQVSKHPDAFRAVESYVIPQYKKALAVNEEAPLALEIQKKIVELQRKYDLILFQLTNGRPTLQPPYFLRAAQELGTDSNVTFAPTETTIQKSHQSSIFSKSEVMGRYTFYYKNFISISPELRMNYTRYYNRVPEIYRNDNYLVAPALRTAYEHVLWKKPASTLFDYDYNDVHRDVNSKQHLDFASRSHSFMLGERFNYFSFGETILRLRRRNFQSYLPANSSQTTSLVLEQIKPWKTNTLLFFMSYDRTRVNNNAFDTNAFSFRTDLVMSRVRDWFTPSVGLGLTSTDPINDRAARGRELMVNPNVRLSKTIGKHWRGNFKYDYQKNNSKNTQSFAFKKNIISFELEYLF